MFQDLFGFVRVYLLGLSGFVRNCWELLGFVSYSQSGNKFFDILCPSFLVGEFCNGVGICWNWALEVLERQCRPRSV